MSSASTKRANLSSRTQPSPKTDPQGFWFSQCHTKKKSRLWTEKSAKSYDRPSEKCARSPEGFALKIQAGMLRNIQE
jgi:hypothetical protein